MNTPSPAFRHRKRPRDSIEDDEDDHALDAMLVELGIPNSDSKKKNQKKNDNSSVEVIELITPPRNSSPNKKKKKTHQSDGHAVVDLTTSPCPSPSQNSFIAVDLPQEQQEEDEISFSYSPSASPPPFVYQVPVATAENESPEVLSPEFCTNTRRRVFPQENENSLQKHQTGPKQARRLSGRLRDFHSETTRTGGDIGLRREESAEKTEEEELSAVRTTKSLPKSRTRSSPSRTRTGASPSKSRAANTGGKSNYSGVTVVVQMERSLDTSVTGESIRNALKSHVYNGKPVPFTVSTALRCIMPGVIRWERKENGDSHFSCAIYFEADAFLEMMQQKSYSALVATVLYLRTLVPKAQQQNGKSRVSEGEQEPSKFFVVIEGMDRALIELKKQQKQKKKQGPNATISPLISFADLHEVAFQLFMDVDAHTKFTCDVDSTADYFALLTREMVMSYSRASALEEFLESVPRNNSFRVTRTGATTSACANAWLRMLQVIPGVSEDKAQCLLDHFPTFGSLMRAYRDPTLSQAQKEDMVSDKLYDARIQRALSKRIYLVFCEENPDAMI